MPANCVFCQIVAGEAPATVVHETESVLAFRDLNPRAPVHVLTIPKQHHADAGAMAVADPQLTGEVLAAARKAAEIDSIAQTGYRLVFNVGRDAVQTVDHVHCHVLGGRHMTWPPG